MTTFMHFDGQHLHQHAVERDLLGTDDAQQADTLGIKCCACEKEPKEVVETPCCGEVWCWQCAVDRPPKEDHCSRCGAALPLEAFRPAKAIEALMRRSKARGPTRYTELTTTTVLPCPEQCGEFITAQNVEEHLKTCAEVAEPCPNGCYERNIKRKEMAAHLRDDCPLAALPCKFGCDELILRREMEEHMEENMLKHLEQLHATVEAQKLRIAELESSKPSKRAGKRSRYPQNKRIKAIGGYISATLVSWVLGFYLITKLLLVGAAVVALHEIFTRWATNLRMPRPFGAAETNILFGLLLLALALTFWPILFFHFLR